MAIDRLEERLPDCPGVALAGLLVVALAAVGALAAQRPPRALPPTAPAEAFSAGRALEHVRALAAAPRPLGSVAHRRAREYLLGEMAKLGLTPEVRGTTAVHRRSGSGRVRVARVHNLVGRLSGGGAGGALLLMAHYDSRPNTPGAGDDASGVAVVLETVRALRRGPAPDRDLIVLLTDAEELGLLGARAFVAEDPLFDEVELVLNFEARGARGAAPMFETGAGSLALMRIFADAAPMPLASSLSVEVYRRMPNDTDFTVFKEAGKRGLNFAFIQGLPAYHSALDTVAGLDPASLQHEGANALAVVRRLAGAETVGGGAADALFFNPWGWRLTVLPLDLALPLAVAGAVAAVALALFAGVRRRLTTGELGSAVLLCVLALPAGPLAAALLWKLVADNVPGRLQTPHGLPYGMALLGVALAAAALAAVAGLGLSLCRRVGLVGAAVGVCLVWAALSVVSALLLPGASFLFLWPLIGLLAGVGAATVSRRPAVATAAVGLGSVPGVVLLAPVAALAYAALTARLVVGALAPVALMLCLLLPLLLVTIRRWSQIALAVTVAALVLLATALAGYGYGAERPRAGHLIHLEDLDQGSASWLSSDREPHPWIRARLGPAAEPVVPPPYLDLGSDPLFAGAAQPAGAGGPRAELVDDVRAEGRTATIRVSSPGGAGMLWLWAEAAVQVPVVEVAGRRIERGGDEATRPVRMVLAAIPAEGIEITFQLSDRWPLELHLVEQFYGLPEDPADPAPADLIPAISWRSHARLVHRSFLL